MKTMACLMFTNRVFIYLLILKLNEYVFNSTRFPSQQLKELVTVKQQQAYFN